MSEKKSEWNVSVGGLSVGSSSDGRTQVSVGGIAVPTTGLGQSRGAPMNATTLAAMGVQARKIAQTGAAMAAGSLVANTEVTRYEMRLPVSTRIRAAFRKESWGDAVVKVFKKELQTGDAAFDKLVYISTDTPERTLAFLTPAIREAITFTLETGGCLEIDDETVVAVSGGLDSPGAEDDRTVVKIVRALLDLAAT